MGWREPLDLSAYIARVGGHGVLNGGEHIAPAAIRDENRREAEAFAERLAATPQKMGRGPAGLSTCVELVTVADSRIIWDVSGYYRALGISWPFKGITKRALREAYQRVDGQSSERLTAIFKLLLDPQERARYDLAPPGELHYDEIAQLDLRARSKREAALRSQRGTPTTKEEVLDGWGMRVVSESDEDEPDPARDSVSASRHTAENPSEDDHWMSWPWGYYLWRSRSRDTLRLAQWQALLVMHFAAKKARMRFCVGLHGGKASPSPWVTAVSGRDIVIFLNDDTEPTDDYAAAAVAFVLDEHTDETVRRASPNMSNATAVPKFGRGGAEAREQAKAMSNRPRTRFLTVEDNETVYVRFIDDSPDWIRTLQHEYVPTKDAPSDFPKDAKWPTRAGAVCRRDPAFEGMHSDCYICEEMWDEEKDKAFKPALRIWARAVIREPVIGTQEMFDKNIIKKERDIGRHVGYRDSEVEEPEMDPKTGEATGRTKRVKNVVIVCKGMKNFFGALQGAYDIYHTVLDRDFAVKREGKGKDTEYNLTAMPEIKDKTGEVWTLEDDEVRAEYEQVVDLVKYITEQASDDRYARYFDPTKTPAARKKKDSGETKRPASARKAAVKEDDDEAGKSSTPTEVDPDALAAMRSRVRKTSGPKPEEAETKGQEPEGSDDDGEDAAVNFA